MSTATVSRQKERHILFSGDMVRAILDGRKTQTRRIVKPYVPAGHRSPVFYPGRGWRWTRDKDNAAWPGPSTKKAVNWLACPYGVDGDRLYVRENWAARGKHTDQCSIAEMHANPAHFEIWTQSQCYENGRERFNTDFLGKWRPSIHMPKEFAKLWLEITKVRVERLQDIIEEDAIAEGIEKQRMAWKDYSGAGGNFAPIPSYASLWDSLHGKGAWDENPWVWVLSFCRVDSTKSANANRVMKTQLDGDKR